MSRKRLGDMLLEKGVITEKQLAAAPKEQKKSYKPLTDVLLNLKFIDEDKLAQTLAELCEVSFVNLAEIIILAEVIKLLPKKFCLENKVIPISKDGNCVTVAMVDPFDVVTLDMVTLFTGSEIQIVVAKESQILAAVEKFCVDEEPDLMIVKKDEDGKVPPGMKEIKSVEDLTDTTEEPEEQKKDSLESELVTLIIQNLKTACALKELSDQISDLKNLP